jgi:carboxymethylenebutenolidase
MPALLTVPDCGDGPAVLLVADIFGRSPFYDALAGRLTAAGYVTLSPDIFFREAPVAWGDYQAAFTRRDRLDENQAIRELGLALAWLRSRPEVRGTAIGTLGFCMGGTLVLDLAAADGDLATICYYGFPASEPDADPRRAVAPLDIADRIRGPVLGFWGEDDGRVGVESVRRFAGALSARGEETDIVVYPGVGHGFFAASALDPEHKASAAAADSWEYTLRFLAAHLGDPRQLGDGPVGTTR